MMLSMDAKCRWMSVVRTVILIYGIFLKSYICEHFVKNKSCSGKNILLISAKALDGDFPSEAVVSNDSLVTVCFDVNGNESKSTCCQTGGFNCNITIQDNGGIIIIPNKMILQRQEIIMLTQPVPHNLTCASNITNGGGLLNIHNCLNTGKKNIKITYSGTCTQDSAYDDEACKGLAETDYKFIVGSDGETRCVSCELPGEKPEVTITMTPVQSGADGTVSPENAVSFMSNLASILGQMGNSNTAAITSGDIKGIITKIHSRSYSNINCGITASGNMRILGSNTTLATDFYRLVHIPGEASAMAAESNGSFASVVLFPKMDHVKDDHKSYFLNNEVMGIEMGAEISNLSDTIDIHYRRVNKSGMIASCRSWDGKGKKQNWVTDGCHTKETNGTITCQCSHLTFFAILMSPAPANMTTPLFKSLSYITSVGCGLSIFFLTVALFMHFLMRKGKSSQAAKLLMNLFVAMLALNLCFLINQSIANIGNFGTCVAMGAFMHYTMLATFTWFFIEALHLHFNLWKRPTEIKHYMIKMCFSGWAIPAIVVITLLALKKYGDIVITTDNGNSEKMCWIPDAVLQQGVNIGYYVVVFLFTLTIFIVTVRQIVLLEPAAQKAKNSSSIKTNSFSILGLFLLLGITWAFAFFSHGVLLIPSYFIFTILNSFQGFFLFIYYYNSRKTVGDVNDITVSSNHTATSTTSST